MDTFCTYNGNVAPWQSSWLGSIYYFTCRGIATVFTVTSHCFVESLVSSVSDFGFKTRVDDPQSIATCLLCMLYTLSEDIMTSVVEN